MSKQLTIEEEIFEAVAKLSDEPDIVKYERTNYETVVIYHTRDVWFSTTLNSAYMMAEIVQEMVGLRTQAKWYHDSYYSMDRPTIAYHMRQMNKIRDKVKLLGYSIIRDDGQFFVFWLPERVEKTDIVDWLNSEKNRREKLKRYFATEDFGLFKLCRELANELMCMKVKGNGNGKEVMLGMLVRYGLELHEYATVWEAATDEAGRARPKQEILRRVERCCFVLSAMSDRRLVDDGTLIRIGTCMLEIRNAVEEKSKSVGKRKKLA